MFNSLKKRLAVTCASVAVLAGVFAGTALAIVPDGTGYTHARDVACHDAGLSINFCGLYFVGDQAIGQTQRRYTWESYNPYGCSYYIYVTVNGAGTIVGNSTSLCLF